MQMADYAFEYLKNKLILMVKIGNHQKKMRYILIRCSCQKI